MVIYSFKYLLNTTTICCTVRSQKKRKKNRNIKKNYKCDQFDKRGNTNCSGSM